MDLLFEVLLKAKQLMQCRKYPLRKILLLNAKGINIPFKDKTIDIVFCLETFEHIPNSNKFINEIFRILKDDGELIYSIPIEIGISLLYRQLIRKIINCPVDSYSFKELIINAFLKKPPKRINNPLNHKNFDWRRIQKLINKKFTHVSKTYSPFPFLKTLNPTIIFKVIKRF